MGILESIQALLGQSKKEQPTNPASSTSAYVDWLPKYLLGSSITEATIDSLRPLPGADTYPGTAPDPAAVVNRLKVLSGLSPVKYDTQQTGQFSQQTGSYRVTFKTAFNDKDGRSRCSVVLSIRSR